VEDYVEAKIVAFTNILEACRHNGVPHLTYASTSSVYQHADAILRPLRRRPSVAIFMPRRKRANELMAHAYGHLFRLPRTGLRFCTARGTAGLNAGFC
jgi:UDP-glucuronate 4-epimerase